MVENALVSGCHSTHHRAGPTRCSVKDQKIMLENGKITGYQVHMLLTFVLDD